jgi:ADP-ribosylglycohydrolase
MRISPVGHAYDTLEMVKKRRGKYSYHTHNHPEGIKGAQYTAAAISLGRTGASKRVDQELCYETLWI